MIEEDKKKDDFKSAEPISKGGTNLFGKLTGESKYHTELKQNMSDKDGEMSNDKSG